MPSHRRLSGRGRQLCAGLRVARRGEPTAFGGARRFTPLHSLIISYRIYKVSGRPAPRPKADAAR